MGTQQLLLIVLGMIVIGVAIAMANNLFSVQSEDSTKDRISNELVNLATVAQQYYAKPVEMGGGGKNFSNWLIPSSLDTTTSGTYSIFSSNSTELILIGSPIESTNYTWEIKSVVTQNNVVTEIMN